VCITIVLHLFKQTKLIIAFYYLCVKVSSKSLFFITVVQLGSTAITLQNWYCVAEICWFTLRHWCVHWAEEKELSQICSIFFKYLCCVRYSWRAISVSFPSRHNSEKVIGATVKMRKFKITLVKLVSTIQLLALSCHHINASYFNSTCKRLL